MELLFPDIPVPVKTKRQRSKKIKLPYMFNLPPGLTPAMKRIYKMLVMHENSYMVKHKAKNYKMYYRFIDGTGNPLNNFAPAIPERMIQRYFLKKCDLKILPVDKEEFLKLTAEH